VKLRFEFISDAEAERLFAEADAILLPYREIDASGVAMSAVARGLPVLATAIDGFCELFEGESGARLVPAADPQALAGVIAEWTTKPAQLDELAEAMRLKRSRIPSWREIACQHLEVYAEARSRWSAVQEVKKGSLLTERRPP
jgi:glycosyltransferase involved in cell wall biosynthesis